MRSTLFYRYLYATLKEICVRRFVSVGKSLKLLWAVFAVSAITFPATANELSNGGYVEGEIAVAQEVDTWTFEGDAGDIVSLQMTDENQVEFAPLLRVYSPSGTLLSSAYAHNVPRIDRLELPESGSYTVTAQDADISGSSGDDDTGAYRIYFVKPPVSEHGALLNGSYVEQTIELGDIDSWQFDGDTGDIISMQITDEDLAGLAPLVRIYTPSGAFLQSAFDHNVARFDRLELPESGSYTVVVQDADISGSSGYHQTGNYRIYFVKPPINEHGFLINGGYVEETIELGDIDTWQFDGDVGDIISMQITDEDLAGLAPLVRIYTPSGAFLQSAYDHNVARFDRLELPESGSYTVVMQDANISGSSGHYQTGDYRIYFVKPPVDEHGSLINGGYVEETIELGDIDTWQFDGDAGDIISMQITDEDLAGLAPLVRIYTPSGAFLQSAFDHNVARFDRLELPESGSYTVVMQDANISGSSGHHQTGDYRIYFMKPPVNEHGSLVNGGYVEETIELGDIDTWQFDGDAGDIISMQITDEDLAGLAPLVRIYTPSGAFLQSAYDHNVARFDRLELPESGSYTVVMQDANISGSSGHHQTGDYRIYFMKPPVNEHGSLINGGYVEETIELGDIDTWQFDGDAGDIISMQITDEDLAGLAPLVRIYTPSGAFLQSAFDHNVARFDRLELPESGSYTVVMQDANISGSSGHHQTGDYRIYFVNPPVNEHGSLINGGYVEETIELGDIDTWQFDGDAGDIISMQITDEDLAGLAPLVRIYTPSGAFLQSTYAHGVARVNRLELPESGNYTVVIQDADISGSSGHYQTGVYRIYFVKPPVSEHGALINNGYVEQVTDFGDLDTWHFDAANGDTISIEIFDIDLGPFAPFGQLYDPDGLFLTRFIDHDIAVLNEYPLLKTGTYTLVVQDADISGSSSYEQTGPYRIGFNLEPGEPEPVPPSASIYTPGSVYRFETITLDGSGSTDPDAAPLPLTYDWTIVSLPVGSELDPGALDDVTSDSATIVPDVSGEYVFSLTVDDGLFTDIAEVTVTVMNRAPVAIAGEDREMATGGVVSLDGSDSYDLEGDTLTYSWSLVDVPAGSSADIEEPAAVIISLEADIQGVYVVALVVNDGEANSTADTVTITVIDENVAPVALSSVPLEALVGDTVMLYGTDSYDPDNGPSPLSYEWYFGSIPVDSGLTNADIADSTTDTASFAPDVDGNFTVWLTVSDGELSNSISATTYIGALPVCSLNAEAGANVTVDLGDVVSLDGSNSSFTDACTDVAFSWQFVSVPGGSVLDNNDIANRNTSEASFMPDTDGAFVLRLMLESGETVSADNVTISVEANESPIAIAGEDQTQEVQSTITLDGSASYDPDNGPSPLTYLWQVVSQPSGSNVALSTPTAAVSGFFAMLPGDYVLSLTVSDSVASDIDEIVISIEAEEEPLRCDVNGDNVVDNTDIMAIFASRYSPATGPDDPADFNGDGVINVLDARGCVLQCTYTNCAVQQPQ